MKTFDRLAAKGAQEGAHAGDGIEAVSHEGTGEASFASEEKLASHFAKHSGEFKGAYSGAKEYLLGARHVIKHGTKVGYQYGGENRVGYVKFMGNSSRGASKFEFVGTNKNGFITTYHVESGNSFWRILNGNTDRVINPLP